MTGPVAGLVLAAQRQQHLPTGVELHHHMISDIRNPDIVVAVDPQSMRRFQQSVPPGAQEFSLFIENDDGRLSPLE